MDLAAEFSAMPDATPLAGLPDAWLLSLIRTWGTTVALSADRAHAFRSHAFDSYDEDLALTMLTFAREHPELVTDEPLTIAEGFAHPGYRFDCVVAFGPSVHRSFNDENPALHKVTRSLSPAFRCEFAGDEDVVDAQFLHTRAAGVPVTRWNREPHPYLKARYQAPTGRIIPRRGFTRRKSLGLLIDRLDGERFVEFENYRHQVWRVERPEGWTIAAESEAPVHLELDELQSFVDEVLYGPNR
jgi:hypothetical protein